MDTEAIGQGSGGTGIQSVSGETDVADTVLGAEEVVPDTARVEGSPDDQMEKAGSGHALENPEYLPGVRVGEVAGL